VNKPINYFWAGYYPWIGGVIPQVIFNAFLRRHLMALGYKIAGLDASNDLVSSPTHWQYSLSRLPLAIG
jgi:hypothetical protein